MNLETFFKTYGQYNPVICSHIDLNKKYYYINRGVYFLRGTTRDPLLRPYHWWVLIDHVKKGLNKITIEFRKNGKLWRYTFVITIEILKDVPYYEKFILQDIADEINHNKPQ